METIYPELESTEDGRKPECPPWLIDSIAELSKSARTLHLIFVGFMVYCALSILSTTDRKLILNQEAHLPVADIDVPFNFFVLVVPFIAIIVFIYFQLHLQALKDAIRDLRTNYAPVEKGRLYPWVTGLVAEPEPGFTGLLQRLLVNLSLWILLPAVLMLFIYKTLKTHSEIIIYPELIISFLGALLVFSFWYRDAALPKSVQPRGRFRRLSSELGRHRIATVFGIAIIFIHLFFMLTVLLDYKYMSHLFRVDLSGQVLVTEQKEEYEIYWADFREARLEGALLYSTFLKRANFSEAQLRGASFGWANLEKADFSDAHLQDARFYKAKLVRADLSDAELSGASFQEANLSQAKLYKANFYGAKGEHAPTDFSSANLEGADLSAAILDKANFSFAHLNKAKFRYAKLSNAQFIEADLREADFTSARLHKVSFMRANLSSAQFDKLEFPVTDAADLTGANLSFAVLIGASFSGVNLSKTNFTQANLEAANLSGAVLIDALFHNANLRGAKLQGADLRGAMLQRADLREADLREVSYLTIEQLINVTTLYRAMLDEPLMEEIKTRVPYLLEDPEIPKVPTPVQPNR